MGMLIAEAEIGHRQCVPVGRLCARGHIFLQAPFEEDLLEALLRQENIQKGREMAIRDLSHQLVKLFDQCRTGFARARPRTSIVARN